MVWAAGTVIVGMPWMIQSLSQVLLSALSSAPTVPLTLEYSVEMVVSDESR